MFIYVNYDQSISKPESISVLFDPFDDDLHFLWCFFFLVLMMLMVYMEHPSKTWWKSSEKIHQSLNTSVGSRFFSGRAWSGGQCSNRGGKITAGFFGPTFSNSQRPWNRNFMVLAEKWYETLISNIWWFRYYIYIYSDSVLVFNLMIQIHTWFLCIWISDVFSMGFSSSLQPPSRDATCSVTGPGNGQAWDRRCRPGKPWKTNAAYKKWAWTNPQNLRLWVKMGIIMGYYYGILW